MRVTVLGAGALGCLFGGYLAKAGVDTVLVDPWAEHVEALRARGLVLREGEAVLWIPVEAALPGEAVRTADVVLFCVKAHQTRAALAEVPPLLGEGGAALTLQNGLGAADLLAEALGPDRVLVGTTAQGATRLGPGEIRHGGSGETVLGGWGGDHPLLLRVTDLLTSAGLRARAVPDVRPAVWRKLAVNCAINALTALTGIRNGRIPEIPEAAAVAREAAAEAGAVARAAGVDLGDPSALGDHALEVASATAANRSSMGQDVDRRQPTEIDFINGAVAREGVRLGVPAPVNATLARLVKTLEATFGPGG